MLRFSVMRAMPWWLRPRSLAVKEMRASETPSQTYEGQQIS
jgi:hypothetical protein